MPRFNGNIRSKLPNTGTTIFTTMSKMANDYNAINLSQGFPDFPCSEELTALVYAYMKAGENQYAPMQGVIQLREKLSEKIKVAYNAEFDPVSEINITAGATQALYAAITAVVREGDEVIVFTPAYDCYVPAITLAGGVPVFVRMDPPDFKVNWEDVKKLVNQRTRMIIINTPHNPSATVLTKQDMDELDFITKDSDIIILSDEVYEHIIFDGAEHQSILKYPSLAERSFVVFSFGKTLHVTGWKMGYCVAPENLMAEFRKVHQFEVFTVNRPIQMAIADYLDNKDAYLSLSKFYQEKRDLFVKSLEQSRFKIIPCQGTYFQLAEYSEISDEADIDFVQTLTKEHGVAAIPISVFYSRQSKMNVIRFCFAKENETLERAAEILCKI